MIAPARRTAFDVLLAHDVRQTDLPSSLAAARRTLPDVRDQALLTELTTGTIRMRLALDHQTGLRSRRPLRSLDAEVRTALRLGAFQLLYLDRLPASAVVNDAVSLTRRAGKTSAAGMVNAVLRALARERNELTWPDGNGGDALAIRHSHPEWLVRRWLARHGEEATVAWLTFNNTSPRLCLATNRARGTRDELAARLRAQGVETVPTARAPHGLHVESGAPLGTEAFDEGRFVVQDEASQLVADLPAVRPGQRVLDLCASPGGKTVALAAAAGSEGLVVACDVRTRRVRLLRQTLRRAQAARTAIVHIDPSADLPFADASFDVVLVDAPCSGLGTLRRDPDIRWNRTEADLPVLAGRQRALLHRAARLVRPGGTLVYATCSSEPEENDDVVAAFLAERRDFAHRQTHRTSPPADALEAFYGAVLTHEVS